MEFNPKIHPEHLFRNLNPHVTPRVRHEDIPDVDDFEWNFGEKSPSIWCTDKRTQETLFVVAPPKTMREALIAGFMAGFASGYKTFDYTGLRLIEDLYREDVAHYQLYGYYPNEEPVEAPPITEAEYKAYLSSDLPTEEEKPPKKKKRERRSAA